MQLIASGSLDAYAIIPEALCGPRNQTIGQLKADCSLLNVNGSHLLTLSLLLLIDSSMSSLYSFSLSLPLSLSPSLSHTRNSPCAERWMGCSQTTGAAPLVSLSHSSPHSPDLLSFFTFTGLPSGGDCGSSDVG